MKYANEKVERKEESAKRSAMVTSSTAVRWEGDSKLKT